MPMNLEQVQRMDIDKISNDRISLIVDNFNVLTSPLEVDLLDFIVNGYNWSVINEQYIKYNLTENDKLVFNVDKISELLHKNITNIKVEFDIVDGNNDFIFNGINLIHDDVIKTKLFNVFMDDDSFSFNCGLFNYDDLDFVINSKGFQLELLFNGNKINSLLVLENVKLVFSFTDKLQGEKDTIYNRIETDINDLLDAKQDKLVNGVNIRTINHRNLLGSGNIDIEGSSVTVDAALSDTSTNPVQNKVITNALDGKANSSHEHTTSDITDFPALSNVATSGSYDDLTDKPTIPSKTSDLTNDGDGTNVFVKDNDARLSDARTPLSHNHDDRYYTQSDVDALLSAKQDLIEDTGWKNVTYNSGWTDYNNDNKLRYRRVGKVVEVRGWVKPSSNQTGTSFDIATISDTTCRPSSSVNVYSKGFSNYHFQFNISNAGVITINKFYNGTTSQSQATTSQVFQVQATYLVDNVNNYLFYDACDSTYKSENYGTPIGISSSPQTDFSNYVESENAYRIRADKDWGLLPIPSLTGLDNYKLSAYFKPAGSSHLYRGGFGFLTENTTSPFISWRIQGDRNCHYTPKVGSSEPNTTIASNLDITVYHKIEIIKEGNTYTGTIYDTDGTTVLGTNTVNYTLADDVVAGLYLCCGSSYGCYVKEIKAESI